MAIPNAAIRRTGILMVALTAAALSALPACAYYNHTRTVNRRVMVMVPDDSQPTADAGPSQSSAPSQTGTAQTSHGVETDSGTPANPSASNAGSGASVEANANKGFSELNPANPAANAPAPTDPSAVNAAPPVEATNKPATNTPAPTAPAAGNQPGPAAKPLRVIAKTDLLDMAAAGLSEATMLTLIEASRVNMEMDSATVIELYRAGIPDSVIQAVIRKLQAQESDGH